MTMHGTQTDPKQVELELAAMLSRAQTLDVIRKLSRDLDPTGKKEIVQSLLHSVLYSLREVHDFSFLSSLMGELWHYATEDDKRQLSHEICQKLIETMRSKDHRSMDLTREFVQAAAKALKWEMAQTVTTTDTLKSIQGSSP